MPYCHQIGLCGSTGIRFRQSHLPHSINVPNRQLQILQRLHPPSNLGLSTPYLAIPFFPLRMRAFSTRSLRWVSPCRPSWSRVSSAFAPTKARPFRGATFPALSRLHVRPFSASTPARSTFDSDSTIYALSTASGRAAIAVVRVSGPACVQVSGQKYGSHVCRQYNATDNLDLFFYG